MEHKCLVDIINFISFINNFSHCWGIFTISIHNYVHFLHKYAPTSYHIKSKSAILLTIYFVFFLTIICKNIVKIILIMTWWKF
jgi:hypothetical protein